MTGGEPRRLGRYELLELLGHGAMGVVYKAHDAFLDRIVAVKTYRQDIPITQNVKTRFEREVRTASKLTHPNVVVVYDGGLEQDVPYLAMEFVEGPTLAAELTRRGRLPVEEALALIVGIADGLFYAHSQGVVHRDLKPANILLSGGKTPKIADFGVAKLIGAQSAATTTTVGTPSYMAPEQIEGRGVDARSDVFALAILSYELLTGRQPFAGEGWTAVLFQIMNVEPEAPSKADPSLPVAIDRVFARALAKDANQRTPDVATFSRELRDAFSPAKTPAVAASSPPAPPFPRKEEIPDAIDSGAFDAFRDLGPRGKEPSIAGPAIAVIVLLAAILAMVVHLRSARRFPAAEPEGTPIAMATVEPTEVRVPPTARPSPIPTARPKPTEPPRIEPTAAPRVEPTAVPTPVRVRPTPPPARPKPTIEAPEGLPNQAPAAPPQAPASAKPTIDVISDPPGAEVIVNGVVKGRTPIRIADLDPGNYNFEVRKQGFNPYRKGTQLEAESDYTMKVTLPQTVNSLRVISQPPGVTVKVNGEPKGKTPLTLGQLPNGHYQVSGELEGFPEQTMGVDLKDGELQEVRFTFGVRQEDHPPNHPPNP